MTEVAKHPWLTRRKDVFYVRAPVPKDIIETFGKREVTYSLRTNDLNEARARIDVQAGDIRAQFEQHRNQKQSCSKSEVQPSTPKALSSLVLQQSCDVRYQQVVDEDYEWRFQLREDLEASGTDDNEWCEALTERLWSRGQKLLALVIPIAREEYISRFDSTRPEVLIELVHDLQRGHLDALEFKLSLADLSAHIAVARDLFEGLSDSDYRRLARRLLETDRSAYIDILKQNAEKYEKIVEKRAGLAGPKDCGTEGTEDFGPGPFLSSLLEAFYAEGIRQGLVVKTLKGDETDLREFVSVVGDKPIRNYVKADAVTFKNVLTRCPANRKSKTYRGLSIADCAALADKNSVSRRLSTSTVNDKLNALSKFFAWADGHVDGVSNPFEGTRIKVKKSRSRRAQDRLPFSVGELQTIFSSTVFTGCRSKSAWKKPGALVPRDSARFWAPLISLYSGLRLGEIIQLRVADIKTDADGICYFDINTLLEPDDGGDAKSLKTTTSERQVPVHPFLFQCGLQELIDKRKGAGEDRLFMDYGPSKSDGSWSKNFSGWFNGQFRPHVGIERVVHGQNRVNFHSFRHNFEDVVRNLPDVKQEVRDALQGHGENGVSAQYGTGIYRTTLDDAMKKVEYTDLDLSHLVLRP